jgi:NADPH2:quinone reductase
MKAIHCVRYGEPEDLVFVDVPSPQPRPNEIVIQVEAVGLGFADGLNVRGGYQVKRPLPFIPGSEVAGSVVACGAGAPAGLLGQRVMALADGALAEEVVVGADQCVALPAEFDSVGAASSLINYSTAIFGLESCGALKPGEVVLVLGASGGVGLAAIDLAKGLGAEVVAAASSAEKLAACSARGADFVVDYSSQDWRRSLERTLDGKRVEVVYDPVGGQWSETAFRCLVPGGRHLVVGFASGEIPRIPLNLPLLKRSSIVGVDWGGHVRATRGAARRILERLIELVKIGKIHPRPNFTYAFEHAPAVLSDILNRRSIGKPVVVFAGRGCGN